MEVEPSAQHLRILAYHSGIAYPPVGHFYVWCAAEVGGGDAAELKRIASEMDLIFGLV